MELNIKVLFTFILMLFLARLGDAQLPAAQPAVFDVTKFGATPNGDISKVRKSRQLIWDGSNKKKRYIYIFGNNSKLFLLLMICFYSQRNLMVYLKSHFF